MSITGLAIRIYNRLSELVAIYGNGFQSFIAAIGRYLLWKLRVGTRFLIFPMLNKFPSLYYIYFHLKKLAWCNNYTDADPLKIIWVDPDEIEFVCQDTLGRPLPRGAVRDGDWDLEKSKFMNREIPKKIKLYLEYSESIEQKIQKKTDKLVEELSQQGYLTQQELLEQDKFDTIQQNNDPVPTRWNEITINIGRNGELLWRTYGQHRLAVAKLLDISYVPVIVCVRHERWQKFRNKMRADPVNKQLQEKEKLHPDLFDILTSSETQNSWENE